MNHTELNESDCWGTHCWYAKWSYTNYKEIENNKKQ